MTVDITQHKRFIRGNAAAFCKRNPKLWPHLEDLVQECWLGMVQAKQNYVEQSGCKFTTYAYMYLKRNMDAYNRRNRLVKTVTTKNHIKLYHNHHLMPFGQKSWNTEQIKEIAEKLNVTEKSVKQYEKGGSYAEIPFNTTDEDETIGVIKGIQKEGD